MYIELQLKEVSPVSDVLLEYVTILIFLITRITDTLKSIFRSQEFPLIWVIDNFSLFHRGMGTVKR